MAVLSDGVVFISGVVDRVVEQRSQDAQVNSLIRVCTWRLIERSGHTVT